MTVKIFYAPYINEFVNDDYYTDSGDGYMKGRKFFFTSEYKGWVNSDWLLVGETPYACFYTDIPRERRILFTMEPPEIRKYDNFMYYLEQFGYVVSISKIKGYSGVNIVSNPHLGWSAGIHRGLDSLNKAKNYVMPEKTRTISIISSLKHRTEYHRRRVAFLQEAQKEFSGVLDCYGREFNPIDDKLDAIAPYKYHIVIENSRHKNYWTEKLSDSWLGWSLPIYCGDPDILEQIPDKNGIVIIDIDDIEGAFRRIHELIDSDVYYSRIDAITACREWVIENSNRYELACRIITNSNDNTPKLPKPELFRPLMSNRKSMFYKFLSRISCKFADEVLESYHRHKGRFWE